MNTMTNNKTFMAMLKKYYKMKKKFSTYIQSLCEDVMVNVLATVAYFHIQQIQINSIIHLKQTFTRLLALLWSPPPYAVWCCAGQCWVYQNFFFASCI